MEKKIFTQDPYIKVSPKAVRERLVQLVNKLTHNLGTMIIDAHDDLSAREKPQLEDLTLFIAVTSFNGLNILTKAERDIIQNMAAQQDMSKTEALRNPNQGEQQ